MCIKNVLQLRVQTSEALMKSLDSILRNSYKPVTCTLKVTLQMKCFCN